MRLRRRRSQWFQYGVFVTGCMSLIYAYSHHNFTTTTSTPRPPASPRLKVGIEQIRRVAALEQRSQFREAISLLESLQTSDPAEAFAINQYKERLAEQIFDRANDKHEQGQVEIALKIAAEIPADTPAYQRYQSVQATWGQDRSALQLAKTYQGRGQDQAAIDVLIQLSPTVKSSSVAQAIRHQAQTSIHIAEARTSKPAPEIAQAVEPNADETIAEYPADEWSATGSDLTATSATVETAYTPPESQSNPTPAESIAPVLPKIPYPQPVQSASTPSEQEHPLSVRFKSQPAPIQVAALPKHDQKSTDPTHSVQDKDSPLSDFNFR